MKKLILGFVCLTSLQVAVAGSYNFECVAYHLDSQTNEISKLNISREKASLDNLLFETLDPNIDLLDGVQAFLGEDLKTSLKTEVNVQSRILSLGGNIGPRDHHVDLYNVEIEASLNGLKETYTGTCTETTISSCGGSCN